MYELIVMEELNKWYSQFKRHFRISINQINEIGFQQELENSIEKK